MALTPTAKLGPYEIKSQIGAGGMGEVYRARDSRLNRDVALKILPESFAREGDRLRRFEQESKAVAALNHPNIVAIYDVGEYNGSPYLVSELLEGENLRAVINRGPIPPRKLVDYAVQVANGLAAAHAKGVAHEWSSEQARLAGRKGGLANHARRMSRAAAPTPTVTTL